MTADEQVYNFDDEGEFEGMTRNLVDKLREEVEETSANNIATQVFVLASISSEKTAMGSIGMPIVPETRNQMHDVMVLMGRSIHERQGTILAAWFLMNVTLPKKAVIELMPNHEHGGARALVVVGLTRTGKKNAALLWLKRDEYDNLVLNGEPEIYTNEMTIAQEIDDHPLRFLYEGERAFVNGEKIEPLANVGVSMIEVSPEGEILGQHKYNLDENESDNDNKDKDKDEIDTAEEQTIKDLIERIHSVGKNVSNIN